jgi:hypothetical protein
MAQFEQVHFAIHNHLALFPPNPFIPYCLLCIFWQATPTLIHATFLLLSNPVIGTPENVDKAQKYFWAIENIPTSSVHHLPMASPNFLMCQVGDTHLDRTVPPEVKELRNMSKVCMTCGSSIHIRALEVQGLNCNAQVDLLDYQLWTWLWQCLCKEDQVQNRASL